MEKERLQSLLTAYAAARDRETEAALTEALLPLAYAIARKFEGRGAEREDLRQVAALALVRALRQFDPSRGLQFSTYATPSIAGTLRNHLRDKADLVRMPRNGREQLTQLGAKREALTRALRRDPTPKELAAALDWPLERVLELLEMRRETTVSSLDAPDESGRLPGDLIPAVEQGFAAVENRDFWQRVLAGAAQQERELLTLRFAKQLSQRDTAARMGVSQMQVSRMERRLLARLRAQLGGEAPG